MLGIVSYHPDVQAVGNSENDSIVDALAVNKSDEQGAVEPTTNIVVEEPAIDRSKPKDRWTMNREVDASPIAVVKLLSAVRLPACHSAVVPVQVKGAQGSVLIEQCKPTGLQIEQSLVETKKMV